LQHPSCAASARLRGEVIDISQRHRFNQGLI